MGTECAACGGNLEAGRVQARNAQWGAAGVPEAGMVVTQFAFVRPGTPTSLNPVEAFGQGMRGDPEDVLIPLWASHCRNCGRVELYTAPG